MSLDYGTSAYAPLIRCDRCGDRWLLPQSARWSDTDRNSAIARSGYVKSDRWPEHLCPKCAKVEIKGDL